MSGRKRLDRSTIKGRQVGIRFSADEYALLVRLVEWENEQLREAGAIPVMTATILVRTLVSRYATQVGLKGTSPWGQRTATRKRKRVRARTDHGSLAHAGARPHTTSPAAGRRREP